MKIDVGVLQRSLSSVPVAEGKTKRIFFNSDDGSLGFVMSKEDITAGDGAKHDKISGKDRIANQTTCNVFRLLQDCGVSLAFIEQIGPLAGVPAEYNYGFLAKLCRMLPWEVVVRREAHGSYLKRAPHLPKGHIFTKLVLEFFLKTSGKRWKGHELVCDDPLAVMSDESIKLFNPKQPNLPQMPAEPFLTLKTVEVFKDPNEISLLAQMGKTALAVFLILEKAWQLQGRKLVDFKVEFGLDANDKLLLADVIDNDSWRVVGDSGYIDKQVYRDGGDLSTVEANFRLVAELTGRFQLPKQRLILWRGSEKDDWEPFNKVTSLSSILEINFPSIEVKEVTCSVHKNPSQAYRLLQELIAEVPDTVIIAYVGMSNGAGPTLAANCTVPVITVPASVKDFPDDVWSSLRTPSNVPVMTMLNPANAVQAALQILAMRNPTIYAALRFQQEQRLDGL